VAAETPGRPQETNRGPVEIAGAVRVGVRTLPDHDNPSLRILIMVSAPAEQFREESLWFGTADRPLFGRLTLPGSEASRGGVLLSPPIGREGRLARRALRGLAIFLAMDGFASLRFDHYGTGDSSGSLDDDEFDQAWLEGIDQGVALLRSLEVPSVSAVGMRMGATILGTSAARTICASRR